MAKRKKASSAKLLSRRTAKGTVAPRPLSPRSVLRDLRSLILKTREGAAQSINSALVLLYWRIGQRIHVEILNASRAAYGEEILSTLSKELTAEFGSGYSIPNLSRMVRFSEVFPEVEIVSTLSKQLGWSHFVEIIPIDDALKREFYAEMCRTERWSVRTLRDKIQGMMFERTALSKKPAKLIKQELLVLRQKDRVTPDLVFRDPYLLNFLGLADTYAEKDLETAILNELQKFILELGKGFTFVDRQNCFRATFTELDATYGGETKNRGKSVAERRQAASTRRFRETNTQFAHQLSSNLRRLSF